jgi:hypothetical protein
MVSLRLAIPAVLIAAVVAACITFIIAIPAPPERIEVDRRSLPTAPRVLARPFTDTTVDIQRHTAEDQTTEDQVTAFQRAADAILKRAQNAKASAGSDEPSITKPVPLPRKRPIMRP